MKNELTRARWNAVETETSRICAVTTLTRSRDGARPDEGAKRPGGPSGPLVFWTRRTREPSHQPPLDFFGADSNYILRARLRVSITDAPDWNDMSLLRARVRASLPVSLWSNSCRRGAERVRQWLIDHVCARARAERIHTRNTGRRKRSRGPVWQWII